MQTTKLKLILAEPEVPVPDTGHFVGSTNVTGNVVAIVITVAVLAIIAGIVIYKLYKAKKLRFFLPAFLIPFVLSATLIPMLRVKDSETFAADPYSHILAPGEVNMEGKISKATFTSGKATITKPDATSYGYNLYILANESNNDLNFIPQTENNETVITSIEQAGALTTNTYGFTLEQDAKAEDDVWYPLSTVAEILNSYTTATTANDATDVYFGILTDDTVLADTYELDVDFYVIATSIYTLSFNMNGGIGVIDDLTCTVNGLNEPCIVTVPNTVPTRTDYNFLGWADTADATVANANYVAGNTITLSGDKTIYAVWEAIPMTIDRLTYMQEFKSISAADLANVKSSMVLEQQYQLKDSRDNKTYYIAKLKDGNIWMIQNLDHDIVTTANYYTPENTDIPENWTAMRATDTEQTYDDDEFRSYDPGDYCWNGTLDISGGGFNNLTIGCSDTDANQHYSVGNYYDWSVAVAMNDTSSLVENGYVVDQSICPAGWTLPSSGSFAYLIKTVFGDYLATTVMGAPAYFPLAGYKDIYHPVESVGNSGNFWSSTVYDDDRTYLFYFTYNDFLTSTERFGRRLELSIRCVAR